MNPIQVRDDFELVDTDQQSVAVPPRYVSRSLAAYPNGLAVVRSAVDALLFLRDTEALNARGQPIGRLRAPFLDEYFSVSPSETSNGELLGHMLVPAGAEGPHSTGLYGGRKGGSEVVL